MEKLIAYRVRRGYTYTDTRGDRERTYGAGEQVLLPAAVGDSAHQLHRIEQAPALQPAPASTHSRRPRRAAPQPDFAA